MKTMTHKTTGSNGCQLAKVSQSTCNRKGVVTRVTSGGKQVILCKQCDDRIGHIVGDLTYKSLSRSSTGFTGLLTNNKYQRR